MLTTISLQKRKVRLESGTPGDWLGPSDQRPVGRPLRPQHTSTTFYVPGPVVSNRVDCIVNRPVMSTNR